MDHIKWEHNQMRVLVPPNGADNLADRAFDVEPGSLEAMILQQALGIQFEVWGPVAGNDMFGNPTSNYQTFRASLTRQEARDLANWLLENT